MEEIHVRNKAVRARGKTETNKMKIISKLSSFR